MECLHYFPRKFFSFFSKNNPFSERVGGAFSKQISFSYTTTFIRKKNKKFVISSVCKNRDDGLNGGKIIMRGK